VTTTPPTEPAVEPPSTRAEPAQPTPAQAVPTPAAQPEPAQPEPAQPEPPAASARAPDSVRRSLSWTLFGELGYAAAQFLTLVVIAKLGSKAALGRFSLGLALATPIVIFAHLHLRPIYVVDTRSRWGFADFLGLRVLLLPISLVVVAAVCLAQGWDWRTSTVVMLVTLIRVSEGFSDIYYAKAQRAETMDPIGISRAVRGLLWIGLLALGMALADEVVALVLVAAAMVGHTLVYDLRKARAIVIAEDPSGASMWPRFDPAALRALAREALPIGLAAGLLGLSGNLPAYILEAHHGVAAVGILAAVMSVRQASGVLNMALGNAAIARLAKLSVDDPRGFWRLLAKLLLVVLVLNGLGALALVWVGDLYLRYAYTAEYAEYLPELILASIAAVFIGLANILSQTLTALSQFRMQLWINLVVVVLSVGIGLWRIPDHGPAGAVETFVVVAVLRLFLYAGANLAFGPGRAR
jgi:O-antigen/teichoic acid export membrane protein